MTGVFLRLMDRISLVAIWIGGGALLLAAVFVSADVLLRKFVGITISGSDEITGYVFAVATSSAIALTLREKSNIRIDLLYNLVPNRMRMALDILSFVAIGLLLGVMLHGAALVAWDSASLGTISVTPLQTPLALPQLIWVVGFAIGMLMWLAIGLRLVACGTARVTELIGAKSLEGEVEAELESISPTTARENNAQRPYRP